tara:strand:+ start:1385 stop:1732 length:348 start_codon:yes stop_codon:yes gene_type:complete
MKRDELLKFHETFSKAARDLMTQKNHDYAGDAEHGSQPFANFERVEALGICSTVQGFLVRMTDKMSRLSSFVESGSLKVKDESVYDTLVDLLNYSVLLAAYLKDTQISDGSTRQQ